MDNIIIKLSILGIVAGLIMYSLNTSLSDLFTHIKNYLFGKQESFDPTTDHDNCVTDDTRKAINKALNGDSDDDSDEEE